MEVIDKMVTTLPVFELKDNLSNAIEFFEQTTFSHLAIVEDGLFIGCLSENDLGCFEPNDPIEKFKFELDTFFVAPEIGWLDLLEKFARNEANILPVVDKKRRIQGYYDLNDIVGAFIDTPFFTELGGVLVIEKGIHDYSFSQIGQIVESNNSKLLGAFITDNRNETIQITLKIANTNLNDVTQTFRRFGYNIVYGNNDDMFLEDLKERSDYLNKYLNV